MFFPSISDAVIQDYQVYQNRREVLVNNVRKDNRDPKRGLILLFENFDLENKKFIGDGSFYYFSGVRNESACVIAISFVDSIFKYSLYVPNCVKCRNLYFGHCIEPSQEKAKELKFDEICFLGDQCTDHDYLGKFFEKSDYNSLLSLVSENVKSGAKIYALNSGGKIDNLDTKFALERIDKFLEDKTKECVVDITEVIAEIRRKKDSGEVKKIEQALDVTALGHERLAKFIYSRALVEKEKRKMLEPKNFNKKWLKESEIQAEGEMVITSFGAEPAYPTVVAGCRDAAVLHYYDNNNYVEDAVLVDMGASLNGYCSDITRTYPAFGEFTEKQKELYDILLGAQECVVKVAKPGFWLSGAKDSTKSLTNFAKSYLKEHGGLDKYMTHSIGHHIGCDVHDGHFYGELQEGNVFTIEPGIYGVPYTEEDGSQKFFSARIEDNYVMEKDGVRCLSNMIPKKPEELCEFMKNGLKKENLKLLL